MAHSYTYFGFTTGQTVQTPSGIGTVTYPGARGLPERVYVRLPNLTLHFHYTELTAVDTAES